MRTTRNNRTGFYSGMISKFLGFPLVGLLLMALCLSLAACGGDDDEIVEQGIDPCGTYVGTCDIVEESVAEGTAASQTIHMPNAQLLVTKSSSRLRILYPVLINENGKWDRISKLMECNYEDLEVKKESVSGRFISNDGNSSCSFFSDGTNVKFEVYDKIKEGGFATKPTVSFEGKKLE